MGRYANSSGDGFLWVALRLYRDLAHAHQVRSKIVQDETIGALGKEFYGLVTPGKGMITEWVQPP